ncbi:MAG TPA: transglycosylase domain-containing protein [Clostridia bacterium]|nr:transglycosylase domain-containing protein [Clostridia bacterium]
MKDKLRSAIRNFTDRLMNAFSLSPMRRGAQTHEEELFVERDKPRPFILAIVFSTFKFLLLSLLLIGCAGMGLVLGVAKAYVDTTPELETSLLTKSDRTSYIYDMNGNLLSTFEGLEYRDWANIEEIPDMLKNAVIAIEDVRFYKHNGVDYKRLFAAVVGSLAASSDAGGSTLTQQLVKNKLLSSEVSYKRKIQEAYLALEIEKIMSKEDILEAYLNDVFLGESNYGVKAAAKDYFGKELSELTIRECAMLAGMIQSPNTTDPRKNTYERTYTSGEKIGLNKMDITDARTDKVINRMYSAGLISKEQRDAALADTVAILETSTRASNAYENLYYIEYAVRQICSDILEQRGLLDTSANRAAVENELSRGGYKIYLCIDPDIQSAVQTTLTEWDDYPDLTGVSTADEEPLQPQAAAVVIDQSTGQLRAIVGGREEPSIRKGFNRAYQSTGMEVGSSIKPLTVYGPALDLGMSPASVIANIPEAIEGWDTETGYPAIGDDDYIGLISMRRAIVSSLNVAAARTLMEYVTPAVAAKYLVNLGVDSSRVKATGSGLALGTTGITPIEMAAAYACIANDGAYLEPIAYTRIVDGNGKVILDAKAGQESRQVFRQTTAWLIVDMLTDAVRSGTGTRAKIDGITVAGKTGTNQDYRSAYFAGMTGYYTAVVWVGDDDYSIKLESGSSGGKVAAPIWQAFMSKILAGRPDKLIIDASPIALGLVQRTVCPISGMLATDACYADANGFTPITEWFDAANAPTDPCDMHVLVSICNASGQPASVYCPAGQVTVKDIVLIRPSSRLGRYDQALLMQYLPGAAFTDFTAYEYMQYAKTAVCTVHNPVWSGGTGLGGTGDVMGAATALIDEVNVYLASAQNLSDTDRGTLETGISMLRQFMDANNYSMTQTYYERLKYNYEAILAANPPAATPEPVPSPTPGGGG